MLYTELFDSEIARTEADRDTAEEILKLSVFAGHQPRISLTTATDSELILQRLARDSAFRQLVRSGDILFPRWPDGKGPTEALVAQLSEPRVQFTDWGSNLNLQPTLRREAIAYLGGGSKTGEQAVNDILSNARELFEAIEQSPSMRIEREKDRRDVFAGQMRVVRYECWKRRDHVDESLSSVVREARKRVSESMPVAKRRVDIYAWNENNAPETRPMIKRWIDKCYNECFPRALGGYNRFHTVSAGQCELRPMSNAESVSMTPIEGVSPKLFSRITWRDILEVRGRSDARQELAARYAERMMGQSELFVVVGAALVAAVSGALSQWAMAAIGGGILMGSKSGMPILNIIQKHLTSNAAKRLDGYLQQIG